jgi:hypothetical protein
MIYIEDNNETDIGDASEEELKFRKDVENFWEVEYGNLTPKKRGSSAIHFGRTTMDHYCNMFIISTYLCS